MAIAGWPSLPDDLVRRIGDSFLDPNDVDCYVDLRAVCRSWRAATDDPKANASDHRFHPGTRIVLDEVFHSEDRCILLNTFSGRFLHKKLPLLLDYYVVATTGGFFVLADRSPPHAARVFNPLTGYMVRLKAPVPLEVGDVAVVSPCAKASSLGLVLLADSSCKVYTGGPDMEDFLSEDSPQRHYKFFRKAVVGGAYPHLHDPAFFCAFRDLCDLLRCVPGDYVKFFSSDLPEDVSNDIRCSLVSLGIHMVAVIKIQGNLFVFNMNIEIGQLEPVQSIGECAIFIDHRRCLSVDVDNFPGIEANCVYYTKEERQGHC